MKNALALIIGNANYCLERNKLVNAVNDAEDFSGKLQKLGFVVHLVKDCNIDTFDKATENFGERLASYSIGLFYFSGHGVQIDGINYLTAVDTSFFDDTSFRRRSIKLDEIIQKMEKSGVKTKIIILDACRDNPFENKYRGGKLLGLAPIHAPKGTIIAFSTSPGEKAQDYGAGRNSIYTGALLNHLEDKNIQIEEFFKRVRTSVHTISNGKQTSWEHTSLIGEFYFNSGEIIPTINIHYREEYLADNKFISSGSKIDSIIDSLRSHVYSTQEKGILQIPSLRINEQEHNSLFLLGRNIFQAAHGNLFRARNIIGKLETWLVDFNIQNKNHVLNGILFEIYFNSKGNFRYDKLKYDELTMNKIAELENNKLYTSSFRFIEDQLSQFKDNLYYIPKTAPSSLPLELVFEQLKKNFYRIQSVKYCETEKLDKSQVEDEDDWVFGMKKTKYEDFKKKLCEQLCIPITRLRLTTNVEINDDALVEIPYDFRILKKG